MWIRGLRRGVLTRLFNLLYGLGRWIYDPLTRVFFGPEWHRWRQTALPWVLPGRTLEIGCGTGQLLADLSCRSAYVAGIDLSWSMLQPAGKKADRAGAGLVQASGTSLPFRSDAFQTVVSTFPAGYLARRAALDEVARVLAPGGRLIVVASARFTRFQWRRPFIHPVLRLAYGSTKSMNRWPENMLAHPMLPGAWHELSTEQGEAFVWIATRAN